MANRQGGLNGIEAISGIQPAATSAVEKITLQNIEGYDYTKAAKTGNENHFLQLTAQSATRKPFSSASLDYRFNDKNYVGGNPFSSDDAIRQKYMQNGSGLKMFEMA